MRTGRRWLPVRGKAVGVSEQSAGGHQLLNSALHTLLCKTTTLYSALYNSLLCSALLIRCSAPTTQPCSQLYTLPLVSTLYSAPLSTLCSTLPFGQVVPYGCNTHHCIVKVSAFLVLLTAFWGFCQSSYIALHFFCDTILYTERGALTKVS